VVGQDSALRCVTAAGSSGSGRHLEDQLSPRTFLDGGAVSDLPAMGGLAPGLGVNLRYFTDPEGFSGDVPPGVDAG